jgi:DNA-binding CsgD family transcriptional regulator
MLREVGLFVGRSWELDALAGVVQASKTGPAAAVVIGEPGSGKSRLLAEAQGRVHLGHSLAVVGYEPERNVPMAAAAPLLRRLATVPDEGNRLGSLLFDREEAGTLDRLRLFEAAHRAFRRLQPTLLVVDDLHWMDDLSYALCHYLIRAARETGQCVAVFAASRPLEGGRGLVDALEPGRVTLIELSPLSPEEGIQLAMALEGALDRRRAREVSERAEGSPFWIEALARGGGTGGASSDLLRTRLRGAPTDAATLLGVLAVAGRPIFLDDAAAVAGWPPERAQAALHDLAVRGVAVEVAGRAQLAHDLIRERAVTDLPDEVRRRIHERLAGRLEAQAGDDVRLLGEALEHRRAAGLPTLGLASRLATSPERVLLGTEGVRLLASIADASGPFDPAAIALDDAVASLATQLGSHEEALTRWLRVAEGKVAPGARAAAFLAASRAAFALERLEEAWEYLAASRREGSTDPVLELEQLIHEASIQLWLERRTEDGRAAARAAATRAGRMATAAGGIEALDERTRRAYLEALRLEYEAAVQNADAEAMLHVAERREAASRGAAPEAQLSASLAMGSALRQSGRLHEATARFRAAWAQAHHRVLPRLAVDAGYSLARSLHLLGRMQEAEDVVVETSDLAARVGDLPQGRHRVVLSACGISLERGNAREGLARLEEETSKEPSDHHRVAFHREAAVWHARLDGPDGGDLVRGHLDAGQRCIEAVSCPRCGAELLLFSAEALARTGDREQALRSLTTWKELGIREDALHPLLVGHSGGLAEPEPAARARALETTLAEIERSPFAMEALWVGLDLGRALAHVDEARAIARLEATASEAARRGAGTVQELAGKALRGLGVHTWRRSAVGAPLTAREEEVAGLVVEGATNREIARALFLAPKTVERHVSNLLRKLDVRNRTELAARLRDRTARSAGDPR